MVEGFPKWDTSIFQLELASDFFLFVFSGNIIA